MEDIKERARQWLSRYGRPFVTRQQLADALDVPADDKRDFRRVVSELMDEGLLVRVKKNYYAVRGRGNVYTGKLQCHRGGWGFFVPDPDSGLAQDLYITAGNMGDAVHGDRVAVEMLAPVSARGRGRGAAVEERKREGRVIRVLERGSKRLVARYLNYKRPMALPLDTRFHYTINVTELAGLSPEDGDVVHVELTTEPTPRNSPEGRLLTVLGKAGDPQLPLYIALAKHDIPVEFHSDVEAEAEAFPDSIPQEEIERREDLRHLPAVTIDPETARDHDDAVNVEKLPGGNWVLWVHIADVSHYVRPDTALDAEALRRGTSVYFPDRAIPMLPERLSSKLCSLRPDEDRLAFSAELHFDRMGKPVSARFTPSVIRSRSRLTYEEVQKVLEGDSETRERLASLVDDLEAMAVLAGKLRDRRRKRGAIDFDLPEGRVEFGPEGDILGIRRSERLESHRIVEDFMLAANEAVAARFAERDIPAVYRIHEPPDPLKVVEFAQTAALFGHRFPADKEQYAPADFQKLADALTDSPLDKYLSYLMLRAFRLAVYDIRVIGHFGLAAEHYTHFTSPIRRYPDLVVHRILRGLVENRKKPAVDGEALPEICRQSNDRERAAVDAEREVMAWKKALFLSGRLGEDFSGFVSGIRQNGFFVELDDYFLEGFVNLSSLGDDYYRFDEQRHMFIGERRGRIFRLGTRLTICVDRVDMERYLIDFSVVSVEEGEETTPIPVSRPRAFQPGKQKRPPRGERRSAPAEEPSFPSSRRSRKSAEEESLPPLAPTPAAKQPRSRKGGKDAQGSSPWWEAVARPTRAERREKKSNRSVDDEPAATTPGKPDARPSGGKRPVTPFAKPAQGSSGERKEGSSPRSRPAGGKTGKAHPTASRPGEAGRSGKGKHRRSR